MLTPHRTLQMSRAAAVVAVGGVLFLALGPFSGLEERFASTVRLAQAAAFYGLTLLAFAVAPRTRRTDLAVWVLALGVLIELVQAVLGRGLSVTDMLVYAAGVVAATAPAMVERFREAVRRRPYLAFAAVRERDRRRRSGGQGFTAQDRPARDAAGQAWR